MQKKLVSIIVPVYNVESYLERCISSLLNQTYNNCEIVLIDDGSTDNSGCICDKYLDYANVVVCHKKNRGVSSARNMGLEICRGEYVSFVDSDDYVDENYIEEMLLSIDKYNCQVAVCDINIVDDNKNITNWNQPYCDECVKDISYENINFCKAGFMHNSVAKLFHKNTIIDCRFNEKIKIGEDTHFMMQVLKCVSGVSFVNRTAYYYYMNPNSVMHENYSIKNEDELIVWNEIRNSFPKGCNAYNSSCMAYCKVCRRVANLIYKSEDTSNKRIRTLQKEVWVNLPVIWKVDDKRIEKFKLLMFSISPRASLLLYVIKNIKK